MARLVMVQCAYDLKSAFHTSDVAFSPDSNAGLQVMEQQPAGSSSGMQAKGQA